MQKYQYFDQSDEVTLAAKKLIRALGNKKKLEINFSSVSQNNGKQKADFYRVIVESTPSKFTQISFI